MEEADAGDTIDRFEEKTIAERGPRTPPRGNKVTPLRPKIPKRAPAAAGEPPVQSDESRMADGTGELGVATLDEPTLEDQAQPLPPLSVVPPMPRGQGKRPAPPRIDPKQARLICIAGNDSGRNFALTGRRIVVGRGLDNAIVLTDIAVSRRHMEIDFLGDSYIVRDMRSGNGTLVNDEEAEFDCVLKHGDRIEIGNTIFRFEHPVSKGVAGISGWGQVPDDVDEDASTIAGRRPPQAPESPLPPPRNRMALPEQAADLDQPPLALNTRDSNSSLPSVINAVSLPYHESLYHQAHALQPRASRKVMIGLITALLAVVIVSIVVILVDDDTPPNEAAKAGEPAASAAKNGAAGDSDKTAGDRNEADEHGDETASDSDKATEHGDETASDSDKAAEHGKSASDSDKAAEHGDKSASDSDKAAEHGDESTDTAHAPTKPTVTLPVSTWGTNEVVLAAHYGIKNEPTKVEPWVTPVPDDKHDADKNDGDSKSGKDNAPDKHSKNDTKSDTKVAAKTAPKPTAKKTPKPKTKVAVRRPHPRIARRRRVRRPVRRWRPRRMSTLSTRRRALSLYRKKQFSSAAKVLRTTASNARVNKKDAATLRAMATNYEAVSANLARAARTKNSNPTASMAAYRRALRLDQRSGHSAHSSYIRIQLGIVAPKAAASYMVQGRYAAAKKAADAAVNYGSGGSAQVRRVRMGLSRKAAQMYRTALGLRKSNKFRSKLYLRRILKMVAAKNVWYQRAYKLLNSRRSRDDDE